MALLLFHLDYPLRITCPLPKKTKHMYGSFSLCNFHLKFSTIDPALWNGVDLTDILFKHADPLLHKLFLPLLDTKSFIENFLFVHYSIVGCQFHLEILNTNFQIFHELQ